MIKKKKLIMLLLCFSVLLNFGFISALSVDTFGDGNFLSSPKWTVEDGAYLISSDINNVSAPYSVLEQTQGFLATDTNGVIGEQGTYYEAWMNQYTCVSGRYQLFMVSQDSGTGWGSNYQFFGMHCDLGFWADTTQGGLSTQAYIGTGDFNTSQWYRFRITYNWAGDKIDFNVFDTNGIQVWGRDFNGLNFNNALPVYKVKLRGNGFIGGSTRVDFFDNVTYSWSLLSPGDATPPTVGQTQLNGFKTSGAYLGGTGGIQATATDADSGINLCYYTLTDANSWLLADKNATHCYKNGLSLTDGSIYQFNMKAIDNNSNTGIGTATITYTADTTAPTTTDNASTTWSDINETITLTPTDARSGVANTYYCVDTTGTCTPTTIGTSVTVGCISGSVCQQYVRYFSQDNLDNNETTKTSALTRIDKNKPVTSFSGCDGNWTNLNKTATLSPSDTGSGLALTQYRINGGAWTTYTTQLTFSTDGNYKIDYNSKDNVNNIETTNTNYCLIDKTAPTMDFNVVINSSNMLDQNIRIKLTCFDNLSATLSKKLDKYTTTATNIYDITDANGTLKDINYTVTGTYQFFRATCTDNASNVVLTDSNYVYSTIMNLINENTGAAITLADLNTIILKQVYTANGNFLLDLNTSPYTTLRFTGLRQALIFLFTYSPTNTPTVTRYIDITNIPDLNVNDLNINICVPVAPPLTAGNFAQQRLISNQVRTVSVRNTVSNCYDLLGGIVYAYDTGYAQTWWAINKPYEVSTYYLGVKHILAQLDGSVSSSYNVDTLLFATNRITLLVGQDTLVTAPKINPLTNIADLNIVEIVYHAFNQDNTLLTLQVYNGTELLINHTETTNPNDLVYELYYPAYPSITDQNFLRAVYTATRLDGTVNTIEIYFNINGQQMQNKIDYSFAVIVSILFFFFGISLTSAGRTLGLFGIIICLICIAICAFALQYWWVQFLMVGYIICLLYMIIIGKQTTSGGFF